MNRRSYYDILGVSRRAADDEIKAAYRDIARRTHPDRAPDDPAAAEAFKAATEAYAVLSDAAARERYDRYGVVPDGSAYGEAHALVSTGGIADVVRGVARAARRIVRTPGRTVRVKPRISFVDAIIGCEHRVDVQRRSAEDGPTETRTLAFRLPPGVRDGQVLRWRGEGDDGDPGARRGDVVIEVTVMPHERWMRDGDDVVETRAVPLSVLAGGATLEVETVHGRRTLTVPPGTPAGRAIRMEGAGVPGTPAGAHRVVLTLALPDRFDDETAGLLAAFEAAAYGAEGA